MQSYQGNGELQLTQVQQKGQTNLTVTKIFKCKKNDLRSSKSLKN